MKGIGYLLRSEGITSAVIQENHGFRVNAKNTFKDKNVSAGSIPESYVTDGMQSLPQGMTRVEINEEQRGRLRIL